MSKKKIGDLNDGRDALSILDDFEASDDTINSVNIFHEKPNKDNLNKAIKNINNDKNIDSVQKDYLIQELKAVTMDLKSAYSVLPDNIKDIDKESLKLAEITKESANLSKQAFYLLCIRLKHMQDTETYPEGITGGLKQYVTERLGISRSTTYEYLDLYTLFTVSDRSDTEVDKILDNRSKLNPYFPILKSQSISNSVKTKIADKAVSDIDKISKKESSQKAKDLKIKYKIIKPSSEADIEIADWIHKIKQYYKNGKKIKEIIWE